MGVMEHITEDGLQTMRRKESLLSTSEDIAESTAVHLTAQSALRLFEFDMDAADESNKFGSGLEEEEEPVRVGFLARFVKLAKEIREEFDLLVSQDVEVSELMGGTADRLTVCKIS